MTLHHPPVEDVARAPDPPGRSDLAHVGLALARENAWTAPGADAGGETGSTADTKTEAVEQADTSRAESETKLDESPADTAKEGDDD